MGGELTNVRGAVYVPTRAYNAYQTWANYDGAAVERDLGYASSLHLDAIRIFLSYERWRADPEGHESAFEHLLGAAADRDLRVLPILFESAGEEPTPARLRDTDPETACAVRSPSHALIRNEPPSGGIAARLLGWGHRTDRWDETREFVERIVGRYGDDERVLAVEIMNEPDGWAAREDFAREMLRTAGRTDASVPLTMGCKTLEANALFAEPGLDVYQFHCNLPRTAAALRTQLEAAEAVSRDVDRPVWLTEWQRSREEPPGRLEPNYASLARTIHDSAIAGHFFWSLMVKPAYLPRQRARGRMNGVFHEDGAVWSLEDARAIADDDAVAFAERRSPPAWFPDSVRPGG